METLSWIQYIFESGVCLFVFSLFYYLFLSRETFFQFNRFYLLLTPILALLIPALRIEIFEPSIPSSLALFYEAIIEAKTINYMLFSKVVSTTSATFPFSISASAFFIYPIGLIWMSLKLIIKLIRIAGIIYNGNWIKKQGYTVVKTTEKIPAASFFNFLIWSEKNNELDNTYILKHELTHIRQNHSLDNLIMEIWLIILWYNPLIYWFKRELRTTHEFIADGEAVGSKSSLYVYASLLVKYSKNKIKGNLASNFNGGMIKKRLLMLRHHNVKKQFNYKYFLTIPLLIGLFILFSFNMIDPNSINDLDKTDFLNHIMVD